MRKILLYAFMFAFLAVTAGPTAVYADDRDVGDSGTSILSPYWQTGGAASTGLYTFLAITNPSISGNLSRAVTVKAITEEGTTAGSAGPLTIPPGETRRFFIIATNHAGVNSTNTTSTNVRFIGTTTNPARGHVVLTVVNRHDADGGNGEMIINRAAAGTLSMWGAVFLPASNAGFAMEFIGDLGDSEALRYGSTSAE